MGSNADCLYQIALTRVPQVGPVLARNLLAYCGGAREIFSASTKELCKVPGVGRQIAAQIRRPEPLREAERELRWLEQKAVTLRFCTDGQQFPNRLRVYPDAPVLLYSKGALDVNHPRTVAIVGTRQPTEHGRRLTEQLVADLAEWDVVVISGLAYGIDVAAHRQAIRSSIPTLGILGHGLARIYPAEHRQVAERMVEQGGLMTEFVSWLQPEREHFPMRNRIVAGLADALIVVETGRQGGSIITAKLGNDYHKEVMALPGRPSDPQSEGCNWLIKTHRAHLVESADDVAYLMGWEKKGAERQAQLALFDQLSTEERQLIDLLRANGRLHIDQLMLESGSPQGTLLSLLLELECRNMIRSLPGQFYQLTERR